MPFNNVLIEVHLTGRELQQILAGKWMITAVGGMQRRGLGWVLERTGRPPEADVTYSVLVNDFMYAGGDGFGLLAEFDPDAYDTGIDWRQPVIDWIIAQGSSRERPLDAAIAGLQE
ncbi:MAG: hypothetical protein D6775_14775 [Caldilineae bacterium]|nr:MAG: hypothetical protein D6775_14775 [Caldilineae bacterium]